MQEDVIVDLSVIKNYYGELLPNNNLEKDIIGLATLNPSEQGNVYRRIYQYVYITIHPEMVYTDPIKLFEIIPEAQLNKSINKILNIVNTIVLNKATHSNVTDSKFIEWIDKVNLICKFRTSYKPL